MLVVEEKVYGLNEVRSVPVSKVTELTAEDPLLAIMKEK
jgi:hypothetical protein